MNATNKEKAKALTEVIGVLGKYRLSVDEYIKLLALATVMTLRASLK